MTKACGQANRAKASLENDLKARSQGGRVLGKPGRQSGDGAKRPDCSHQTQGQLGLMGQNQRKQVFDVNPVLPQEQRGD